jgi:hypothetical protein
MARQPHYLLCVKNRGYSAALEPGKLYRVIPDRVAEKRRLVRVVDESGDHYLYPDGFFLAIDLPRAAIKALSKKSA